MNVPRDFDIFVPSTVKKPWMWTLAGRRKAGRLEHRRPEEGVEVGDIFANEVVDLDLVAPPPVVQPLAVALAPLPRRADVADGGVEPDVPVVARAIGDLEAEVGRRPGDVPLPQRLLEEVALEVVGDLRLEVAAGLGPGGEEVVELLDVDEQVAGRADLGPGPGERAHRVHQLGGIVGMAALLAVVAVLVGCLAVRASAFDEAVGQEGAGHRVVKLGDFLLRHQPGLSQGGPDLLAGGPGLGAVGAAVVVELDVEAAEVVEVGLLHPGDQLLLADTLRPGPDHDRRAVGIVGADIDRLPAPQLLETDPDIGLQILDQVAQVDVPIGIGQGAGNQDPRLGGAQSWLVLRGGRFPKRSEGEG